jgi:type II restriction/modification system DNA methylase subunit YeeA
MDTSNLKKFAQDARRQLISQVSAKLKSVLAEDSYARRANPAAVRVLENDIDKTSKEQVIERVAYTWFNRFTALRFMDANRYTTIGVVSPAPGQTQPEILAEAKMGHIENDIPEKIRTEVMELLSGTKTSSNPQQRAYKILLVAFCNYWHESMPFLFTRIQDYTELLMPDDFLSEQSIITKMQSVMSDEVCKDVEVIGWLYQFYISEKKEQVNKKVNNKGKVLPSELPAKTALFTPNWIVKYLVENSLGRLWMLNNPDSNLVNKMKYYIKPEQPEQIFLKINTPEEIKVCDPACGSGHMLVYAFDLLHSMYEESGYSESDIPELILTKNLYGVEIDERAGELAAFALTMKARSRQRRFFNKNIVPNICVLENVKFESGELNQYISQSGSNSFSLPVQNTIHQFEFADNLGSLIVPEINNSKEIIEQLSTHNYSGSMIDLTHQKIMKALNQADFLSKKYHVVIANPPYMGSKAMNSNLTSWVKENYPDSKSDLFAMFIERNFHMVIPQGMIAMITMQSWMYIASYDKLRANMLKNNSILTMIHLGENAFDSIGGEVVSTTAFVLQKYGDAKTTGFYYRLLFGKSEHEKKQALTDALKNIDNDITFKVNTLFFQQIPDMTIAYWLNINAKEVLVKSKSLSEVASPKTGMTTGDNEKFLRFFYEVSLNRIKFDARSNEEAINSVSKWFPYCKGGGYRRWYGYKSHVINWYNNGYEVKNNVKDNGLKSASVRSEYMYFQKLLTWSAVSKIRFSCRYENFGSLFDSGGSCVMVDDDFHSLIAFLNCKVAQHFLEFKNPTINYQPGDVASLPIYDMGVSTSTNLINRAISLSKCDWDSYELSWNFSRLLILENEYRSKFLSHSYILLRTHWQSMTDEMKKLEEENNRIFIEAYGLEDELTPDVPIEEITLTCNPYYRYGKDKSPEELEALLLADTMREFISYAVGCMFGRYSLDKPGLILANQGETLQDYLAQVPNPSFVADDDNVIPILDGDWFTDDIVERFKQFLVVTFGEDNYKDNLEFIENALGKDIRKYFLKEFYTDHVKRYKKRPIYWLFTSPKGTFNSLIYMHRYRPDTISIVLNKYLREFKVKLNTRLDQYRQTEASADSSKQDKAIAIREIDTLRKMLDELEQWEHDVIFPLASQKIEIDLDDGVKVNYPKFGAALKKIPGLEAKDD